MCIFMRTYVDINLFSSRLPSPWPYPDLNQNPILAFTIRANLIQVLTLKLSSDPLLRTRQNVLMWDSYSAPHNIVCTRTHTYTHTAGIPPQTTCILELTEAMCRLGTLVRCGLVPRGLGLFSHHNLKANLVLAVHMLVFIDKKINLAGLWKYLEDFALTNHAYSFLPCGYKLLSASLSGLNWMHFLYSWYQAFTATICAHVTWIWLGSCQL